MTNSKSTCRDRTRNWQSEIRYLLFVIPVQPQARMRLSVICHLSFVISFEPLARMRTSVPPYRFARTTDQIRESTAVEPVARSRINRPSLASAAGSQGDDRSSEAGSGSLRLLE